MAIYLAIIGFIITRYIYMVSREEPRLSEIKQGVDLLAEDTPVYDFDTNSFKIGLETGINILHTEQGNRYAEFVGLSLLDLIDFSAAQHYLHDGSISVSRI